MSQMPEPLAPGRATIGGTDIEIVAYLGRIGDGLIYDARLDGETVELREYAPAGIVSRAEGGGLMPADDAFAGALAQAQANVRAQARSLAAVGDVGVPAILALLDSEDGGEPGTVNLVSRRGGTPLAAALAAGMALPPERIMRIADELAATLAVIHAAGVTHLDIAPETVSIASGRVALNHFAVDNRAFIALVGNQVDFVRPGYSPLERSDATGAEPLGPPVDIYAACALLYRLIEGFAPDPWEMRWREPLGMLLPDRAPYPPGFLAAIRKGMAIEPGDRFADGAAWRAALSAARHAHPAAATVSTRPPQPRVEPAPMPAANWLVPLLILLVFSALAGLAYFGYRQGWFGQTAETGNIIAAPAPTPAPSPAPAPPVVLPPLLTPGSTVAGRLTAGDTQSDSGQYADSFSIDARGGEQLEILLSSSDFDPVLSISGPGLTSGNDDDEETGERDSRLVVTLARPGRYTLTASSYGRGETGAYLLRVASAAVAPPPDDVDTVDLTSAARLAGRWRSEGDAQCVKPAVNTVASGQLVSRIGGETHTHRITGTDGDDIRTVVTGGPASGRSFTFRIAPDGNSYRIDGETWTRC